MLRPKRMKPFLFLTALAFATLAQAQKIEALRLDNRQSILNDKAFFQFPAGAVNSARPADIMSADASTSEETRILFDQGPMRLVFFAQELYVTGNTNLLATVSKGDGAGFRSKLLSDRDSLQSVLSTPLTFDTTADAILVNSLLVRAPDHSVFRISAYINPAAFSKLQAFQALSERIFATLAKGKRRLDLRARTQTVPVYDGKKKMVIQLPEGFVLVREAKYDFEVLRFRQVRDLADTNWLGLTLYIGSHPSYFYNEYNLEEGQAGKAPGQFLDQKVEWLYFKEEEKGFYLKEQKIPCDAIAKNTIVHIAMLGNQSSAIERLTALVEKIKLID